MGWEETLFWVLLVGSIEAFLWFKLFRSGLTLWLDLRGTIERRLDNPKPVADELTQAIRNANLTRHHTTLNRRIIKLAEELGEVSEAYLNVTSLNNGKGKTWADVREEMADLVIVALDCALTATPDQEASGLSQVEIEDAMLAIVHAKLANMLCWPLSTPSWPSGRTTGIRGEPPLTHEIMSAPVIYKPEFVKNPAEAFERLWTELAWEQRTARRLEYWTNSLDKPYTYGSGLGARTYEPRPGHEIITEISHSLREEVGFDYEGCFLNGYENARSGLSWHADDDPGINHSRPIAVVTVGAGRAIQFMDRSNGIKDEQFLEPGSLLLMKAGMQATHLHQIPKVGHAVKPRISLTYRSLVA